MEPQSLTAYLVAAGLAVGAIYSAILAYEAYPKGWKVVASALSALALAALAYYTLGRV
jgi:hypothetical protein